MKAENIREALYEKYSDRRRFVVAEEVGLTTGGGCRRIDMIVLDCFRSNKFRLDGFEIKVSTSDLRRELRDPNKHISYFDIIDFFTLVAPAGVVNPLYEAIPEKWGILIVNEDGTTRYRRKPLTLNDEVAKTVPRGFFASLVRNVQDHQPGQKAISEAYMRGHTDGEQASKHMYETTQKRMQGFKDEVHRYEKLFGYLAPMGGDAEEVVEDFKAFRRLDVVGVSKSIDRAIKGLQDIKSEISNEKQREREEWENEI